MTSEVSFNVPKLESKRYKIIVQQLCGRCGDGNLTILINESEEYDVFKIKFSKEENKKKFDSLFIETRQNRIDV